MDPQSTLLAVQGRPEVFTEYLRQYKNTICGRHPIGVLLNVRGGGGEETAKEKGWPLLLDRPLHSFFAVT